MSTRCLIGIEDEKTIIFIYCHHDGYPEGVGKYLKEYYNNEEIIKKLLSLGAISGLENTIERTAKEAYNDGDDIRAAHSRKDFVESQGDANYYYLWKNDKWLMSSGNPKEFFEFYYEV
jgi:hypothetical protein